MDAPTAVSHLYHDVIGHGGTDDEMRELYQVRFPADLTCACAGLLTQDGACFELPQWFWMRVATAGAASRE